jgi:Lysyl oxidase
MTSEAFGASIKSGMPRDVGKRPGARGSQTVRMPPPWRLAILVVLVGCGGNEVGISTGVDLQVDRQAIASTVQFSEEDFAPDDCAVVERAIATPGRRRLLRFDTVVVNRGVEDLVVGDPADPEPPFTTADFEFSPCHNHYHFLGFASYELRDRNDRVVGFGHKQSFCMTDSRRYSGDRPRRFDCHFQGITVGWADRYGFDLDGQWVDVTDVPPGDYVLIVTVNPEGKLPELTGGAPNVVRVQVTVP